MNKPIKPSETVKEVISIHHGSCYGETLKSFFDKVPSDIPLDQVRFNTTTENGYYNDSWAVLDVYYDKEIPNKNYNSQLKFYEEQLEKYNLIQEKEKYLKNNKDKYFEVGEVIYLQNNEIFLDKLEIAAFKKAKQITITKILQPQSRNNKRMNSENWCQVIYFDLDGKEVSSILYSKDVVCRDKRFLTI